MNDKEPFAHKKLLIMMIFTITTVLSALLLSKVLLSVPSTRFSLRAIIIDQLGSDSANPDFGPNGIVANDLRNARFNVSYQTSEAVSVEFYLGLAKGDYGIIILRVHAAMRNNTSVVDFFTSEPFNPSDQGKYRQYLDDGRVTIGWYSWQPGYFFAVSPELIKNLDGTFPKSVVIAMGCNGLNSTALEMAEAFISKGALAYIGWDGLVSAPHTDNETIRLIEAFLNDNKTIRESVQLTTPDYSTPDNSRLGFYPTSAENLTKNDFIADAEGSKLLYGLAHISENEFSVMALLFSGTLVARRSRILFLAKLVCQTVVVV